MSGMCWSITLSYELWYFIRHCNHGSPVQWVDNDMMLSSVMKQRFRFNDSSPVQWVDIDHDNWC